MGILLQPWRAPGRLWRSIGYVVLAMPLGVITFTAIVALVSITGSLLITVVLAVPFAWLTFATGRGIGRVERSRAVALLGLELVDPVPPLTSPTWLRRLGERLRVRSRWRELGYGVLLLPVGVLGYLVVIGLWGGSASLVLLPLVVGSLPGGTAKFGLFEIGPGPAALGLAVVGVLGLVLAAPWASLGIASLEGGLARRLIGSRSDKEVEAQLRDVERRRSAAVDSAEAERRRIERDLHDGAQQRLVALAAELGAARTKFDTDPEAARALVEDAHEEAKAALKEIRDLVRGIHPVILEDRGLDAALSAVVARSPVPVRLEVSLTPRPAAEVESAAYFVVSEALTNVARHAQATRAEVAIARAGNRLVIEVRDDGIGGADASVGTGLQGLRERVVGLGGDLHVISPPGGPTTISVELPCAS
jgi:signal transduction histidine kinase